MDVEQLLAFGILSVILIGILYFVARQDRRKEDRISGLEKETIRNPLTRMFNRRYWQQSGPEIFEKISGSKTIIYIDVDDFKEINDRFGHGVGDEALVKIGKALQVRPGEVAVHLHGDEFLLLIHGDATDAKKVIDRIERMLDENSSKLRLYAEDDKSVVIRLRLTYGVAVASDQSKKSLENLSEEAETAMRANKNTKGVGR